MHTVSSENKKGRDNAEDLGVGGKIILEWFLGKWKSREELGHRPDDQGSIPGGGWEFFSSPPLSDRFWGPPNLLSNGYQGLFPWG
jgi:hypothetical protein